MDLPLLLIGIGIIVIVISFFVGRSSHIDENELERISISLHQETNGLKKRLKVIEEELMMGPVDIVQKSEKSKQPIHEIIVNQILSLNSQGFSIEDIAKRSSLTSEEVIHVLQSRGVR